MECMNMKMIFKELFLFSPSEKKAKRITFDKGINVITSNQEDGTDRGKSVVMRSLYYALGAESYFETKWDIKNKVTILHLFIDDVGYYIYRSADLYKFFDEHKKLLFVSTHSRDLSEKLKTYTRFAVMLPDRSNDKLEVTPPVYNYLPFFVDQDHYEGSKYSSFKNLQQYSDFKDSVLFYHLGIYDEKYFELVRRKEALTEQNNQHKTRFDMLSAMQDDIEKRIGTDTYSTDMDSLKKDIALYQKEYEEILSELNKCKRKLVDLRNNVYEYEALLNDMNSFSNTNEKEIHKLNEHRCPECGSVIVETSLLRSKRYNLAEDVIIIKNELQVSIQNSSQDIVKEEENYQQLLNQLKEYEGKLKTNTKKTDDILRYKGLCEIRDGIVNERFDLQSRIEEESEKNKALAKEIKKYADKKKLIEEKYYELLLAARTHFGLNEIDPEKFKKLTNVFSASGSNKNIATVIWYLAILTLRKTFNADAIEFPIVFDSPNNVETDNEKKHALLQYILENASDSQMIISSIGFDPNEFKTVSNIRVTNLENAKYMLLDETSYCNLHELLSELCDAGSENYI